MKTDTTHIIIVVLSVLLAVLAAYSLRSCHDRCDTGDSAITVRTDTLIVRDTVFIDRPVASESVITDTIKVYALREVIRDTIRQTDTVYVSLPVEQKHYSAPEYDAWVSGFRPSLDSLKIYRSTVQVVNTATVARSRPKPWGIGIQAGYGITLSAQPQLRPYIGIGISYNFIRF